ncbi:MAG: hypothetical protein ACRDKW_18790 [Actinomycetota bacterium]
MEPQLHDLDAALRSEIRLEAEEAERDAARSAAMRRTIRDVAADLMAHGDTVVVRVGDHHTFEGRIAHVGTDFLSIENRRFRTDVRLDSLAHLGVAHRALAGGRGPSRQEAPAWRARLLELELGGTTIRLGLRGLEEELLGRVTLVGADHLALAGPAGGPERFVPFAAVAYLRTARTDGQEDADV